MGLDRITAELALIASQLRLARAMDPDDLPDGAYVAVDISSDEIRAFYSDEDGHQIDHLEASGEVEAYSPGSDTGPCLDAFIVGRAFAHHGWGPMLYDVVMEAAGRKGLTPDRTQVSNHAQRVWRYYMSKRHDLRVRQLDWAPDDPVHITPERGDDCISDAIRWHDMDERDLLRSPLSKVYYTRGTPTMDELRRAGRLIIL